jgi:hypothetical protein
MNKLKNYRATIKESMMSVVKEREPLRYWDYTEDASFFQTETVAAVQITMPITDYEILLEEIQHIENIKNYYGNSIQQITSMILELSNLQLKLLHEEKLRNSNETLKKAYDHYQLLLNLSK